MKNRTTYRLLPSAHHTSTSPLTGSWRMYISHLSLVEIHHDTKQPLTPAIALYPALAIHPQAIRPAGCSGPAVWVSGVRTSERAPKAYDDMPAVSAVTPPQVSSPVLPRIVCRQRWLRPRSRERRCSLLYLGLYWIFSAYCSTAFFFSSAVNGFWVYLDIGGSRWSRWLSEGGVRGR